MQAKEILTQPSKTYKTRENAIKKIESEVAKCGDATVTARYVIATTAEGRFFPVAIGSDTYYLVHCGICIAG